MPLHDPAEHGTAQADEYARIAPVYDAVVGPFLRPVHAAVVAALLGAASGGGPVADLCCGTGAVADMAARAGLAVVGVDSSPAMLHRARARRGGARYLLADASATGLEPGGFAACVVTFALHEKPPETGRAILAEAARLVGPGGTVVVADYRAARGARLTGAAIALVERLAGRDHHACFRRFMADGGSGAFLRRAGLDAGEPRALFMGGWVGLYQLAV